MTHTTLRSPYGAALAALAATLVTGCAQAPDTQADPLDDRDATSSLSGPTAAAGAETAAPTIDASFQVDGSSTPTSDEPRAAVAANSLQVEREAILGSEYFAGPEFAQDFARSLIRRNDVEPDISEDEIEVLQKVLEDLQKEKPERALERLRRENQRFPTATNHYLLGQLLFEEGMGAVTDDDGEVDGGGEPRRPAAEILDEAAHHYEKAIEEFPNYLNAQHFLALTHFQRERFREAAEAFSKELGMGGGDKVTYGLMGVSLMNIGRYLAGETAFRNALLLDPFNEQWRLGLSRCLYEQRKFGELVALVGSMIEEDPDDAELWLLQGNAFVGMNEPERAAENFRIARALGGATASSLNLMADIYTNEGLSDLAVDAYLEALALEESPNPDRALRAIRSMTRTGALEDAGELLDAIDERLGATLSDAKKDEVLKMRSKLAVKLGNSEDEISTLREITARNPLDGEAFVLLGEAYERVERFDEAAQAFEVAAEIEGSGADAKLKHGRMLARRGLYADAVPLLEASLQLKESESVRRFKEGVENAAKRSAR